MMQYRFDKTKDTQWSGYDRQLKRYNTIRHLLGAQAVGAELGVYRGGFGEFLKQHCKRLYLVDPWYRHSPYFSGEQTPERSAVAACLSVMNTYREEMEAGLVQIIIDFSTSFLKSLPDRHLDWVYIDSSHTYKNTKEEIELSFRKVKPGGYLIGDDHHKEGVARAVAEACKEQRVTLALDSSHQWAIQRP